MQYADAVSCYSFVSVVNQVISLIIIQTCLNQRKETTLMKHSNNESIIPVLTTPLLNTIWAIGTSITASAVLITFNMSMNFIF